MHSTAQNEVKSINCTLYFCRFCLFCRFLFFDKFVAGLLSLLSIDLSTNEISMAIVTARGRQSECVMTALRAILRED